MKLLEGLEGWVLRESIKLCFLSLNKSLLCCKNLSALICSPFLLILCIKQVLSYLHLTYFLVSKLCWIKNFSEKLKNLIALHNKSSSYEGIYLFFLNCFYQGNCCFTVKSFCCRFLESLVKCTLWNKTMLLPCELHTAVKCLFKICCDFSFSAVKIKTNLWQLSIQMKFPRSLINLSSVR